MRLTVVTDFALRVLMCLALEPQRRFTIAEIAKTYGISRKQLVKVVNHLTREGLVETTRGIGGGIRLARPPAQITVGETVRGTEEDFAVVECFRPGNACLIPPPSSQPFSPVRRGRRAFERRCRRCPPFVPRGAWRCRRSALSPLSLVPGERGRG